MPPTTAFPALSGTLQSAAGANGNGTTLNTTGLAGAWLQVTGAALSLTLTVNGDVDGNMKPLPVINCNTNPPSLTASLGSLPAVAGLYYVPLGGIDQIQVPVSAYASGNVTVTYEGTPTPAPFAIPVATSAVQQAVNAILAGTTGNGLSKPTVGSPIQNLNATKVAVKASAGTLYGFLIENNQGATTFVQLFDVASGSVTLGTTKPDLEYFVAANSMAYIPLPPQGWPFGTALTIAATTTSGGSTNSANGVSVYPVYL